MCWTLHAPDAPAAVIVGVAAFKLLDAEALLGTLCQVDLLLCE